MIDEHLEQVGLLMVMNVNKQADLLNIIKALERVQGRVSLYISPEDDVDNAVTFLQGFLASCDALGYNYGVDIERSVLAENGWERRADGEWLQMRERGISEEAIVVELVRLEVLKWRKLLAQTTTE